MRVYQYGDIHFRSVDVSRDSLHAFYSGQLSEIAFIDTIPTYADNLDLLMFMDVVREGKQAGVWPIEILGPRPKTK